MNDFSLKNVSNINFFELYQNFISMIINLEVSHLSHTYVPLNTHIFKNDLLSHSFNQEINVNRKFILNKIKELELELNAIKKKIKDETQMKEKLALNFKAKNIKDELSILKTSILNIIIVGEKDANL
ncbi:hypothetical protein Xish_02175 [Xenorhabdus ishibashii]|uniref:Uncharacterized protein n=1 Tax=Xenorhabdus ishibashii TaxID=1034471 RepID=A0A2D0KHS8_9GAMM|nr:hypothetical protein Xish_02175 [Xenorhabdus ishibashii]